MITVGRFSFIRLVLIGAFGLAPGSAEPPTATGWATWAPGSLWLLWGVALAIATTAYHDRRRDPGAVAVADHRVPAPDCPGSGRQTSIQAEDAR